MIENVLIGADPEVFFVRRGTGEPVSAEGLIGGDKWHPVPMEGLPNGFFAQEDNVTAEFNIPPARTLDEFSENIYKGLKYIGNIAKKNNLKLALLPDLDFPKEQLMTKHCQTLGCNPDLNIWTGEENPAPKAPELMRTAAGHVHIGWNNPSWDDIVIMAKAFDLFVTVPSILVTAPNRRRQLYGRAGACRPKKYGVECRSLDNFWLGKKMHIKTVFANTMQAISLINEDFHLLNDMLDDFESEIVTCINDHNIELAEQLVNRFDIMPFAQ